MGRQAFEPNIVRLPGSAFVLMQLKYAKSLYIKVPVCVIHVACPICGALRYEPCAGSTGFWHQDTHIKRRDLYKKFKKEKLDRK